MGAYSKLQAINEMLLYSGETPVDDLEGSNGVDTTIAEKILDQKVLDVQARGLANNITVRDFTAATDNSALAIGQNVLSAEMLDLVEAAHPDVTYARITTTGWPTNPVFLNLTDNTTGFPAGTYTAEIILKLTWEEMDTPIQKNIATQAARQYQMLTQGDGAVDNYLAQLELYYQAKSKGSDTRSKGYNLFDLHKGANKAVDRRITYDYNRSRRGSGGSGGGY
jgi:hypothetical protein|tara:strand:+ start:2454 stop:3122 length:669 start_codon:yes stop_codon:yes gene_type:complete